MVKGVLCQKIMKIDLTVFEGSSAFYLSEGFIIGRASYCEEFILMLFIFDVFYQGIRPPGDKLRSQLTEAGGCKTSLQPEDEAHLRPPVVMEAASLVK